MPASNLKQQLHVYQTLQERLKSSFPDADHETIRDTLEGVTDLHEIIAAIIRSALIDEALQVGLQSRLEEMKQRLVRLVERKSKKRQLALEAMSEAGLKKLEQPDFTASARTGTVALLVMSEDLIPGDYWLPQPPKLNRQALLGELKRGRDIAGVQLSNPQPVLMLRTK